MATRSEGEKQDENYKPILAMSRVTILSLSDNRFLIAEADLREVLRAVSRRIIVAFASCIEHAFPCFTLETHRSA
jgi:hypothetical protein